MKNKIILSLIVVTIGYLNLSSLTAQSITIYPKKTIAGLTKKGTTYKFQTIASGEKSFFVGYDANSQTTGRGFLEFDLTSIPKNADIERIELKLKSNYNVNDNNYNGTVKLFPTTELKFEDAYYWGFLLPPVPIMEINMLNVGSAQTITNRDLDVIKRSFGNKLYLSFIHKYENNKIIRFDGSANDNIKLVIHYKSSSTISISGDSEIPENFSRIYTANYSGHTSSTVYNWTVSNNLEIISGQRTKTLTVKATAGAGSGQIKVTVGGVSETKAVTITSNTLNVSNQTIATNKSYSSNKINISNTTISSNATVSFTAQEKIVISPSFHAAAGTKVTFNIATIRNAAFTKSSTNEENAIFEENTIREIIHEKIPICEVRIYSISGILVYTSKSEADLDLNGIGLNQGVYILEKKDIDGKVTREKIYLNGR